MSKLTVKSKLAAVLIAVMVVVSAVSGWTALFGRASAADNLVKLTYVSPSKIYSDSNKSKDKAKKSSKSDKTAKSKSKQSPKPGNGLSGGA